MYVSSFSFLTNQGFYFLAFFLWAKQMILSTLGTLQQCLLVSCGVKHCLMGPLRESCLVGPVQWSFFFKVIWVMVLSPKLTGPISEPSVFRVLADHLWKGLLDDKSHFKVWLTGFNTKSWVLLCCVIGLSWLC